MEKLHKTCCVTGHRPKGFPWKYTGDPAEKYDYEIESVISRTLESLILDGYDHFICGGAIGVDTIFANELLILRDKKYPHITFEVAVPCPGQSKKWSKSDKDVYAEIIQLADEVNVISEHYTKFCFHKRNEYMVDKSDLVMVVWNGKPEGGTYYTYQYAVRKGKPTLMIMLDDVMKKADASEAAMVALQVQKFGKPIPPVESEEWEKFMGDLMDSEPPVDSTTPSDGLLQAQADISRITKRREKYYKIKREIP